jgi:uncharacterized membrane protein
MRASHVRFIRQQGFAGDSFPDSFYTALMLQPRIVGCVAVVGIVLESAGLFLTLSAVLLWSALVPAWSPFDAIYNRVIAARRGLAPLRPALAPRRFAAAEAGTVALAVAVALAAGATIAAWIIQAVFIGGVISTVFADFCLGAYTYHLLVRPSPGASALGASKG